MEVFMVRLIKTFVRDHKKYAILTPILVAIEVLFDVLIPRVMTNIIDRGINGEGGADVPYVFKMGGVMIVLALLGMFFGVTAGFAAAKAGAGFIFNVRTGVFDKIQDFSFANIDHFTVPSLLTRVTTDMRQIRMAYINIIRTLVRSPIQLIFSFIMVARINLRLASVFLVAVPVLALGLYLIHHTAHPRFRAMMVLVEVSRLTVR